MNRWLKNNCSMSFLIMVLLLFALGKLFAATLPEELLGQASALSLPGQNPAFTEWQQNHMAKTAGKKMLLGSSSSNNQVLGYIPPPYDIGLVLQQERAKKSYATPLKLKAIALPAQYDLRNVGGKSYIPAAIGDQNPLGTCWVFSFLEAIQSNMLKQGLADDSNSDLSQWGIAYGAYNNESAEKQCWDRAGTEQLPYPYYTGGGNNEMAVALISRGSGPVLENTAPYPYANRQLKPGQPVIPSSFIPVRSLRDANLIVFTKENIKNALVTYGAVSAGIWNWNHDALSNDSCNYYNTSSGSGAGGHAITIVGWDDNYSKSNFKEGAQPSSNGAWLAKNSWGSDWGSGGYFYISYEEQGFESSAYTFITQSANANEKVYQYDMFGLVFMAGYGTNSAYLGNVFKAEDNGYLSEVSFWAQDNADYEIKIYTDGNNSSPITGTLMHTQTGSCMPGYHKIKLSSPIAIGKGKNFSVVVKVTNETSKYTVPVCDNIDSYVDKATSAAGRGFVSSNGSTWLDITTWGTTHSNASICVKAFVLNNGGLTITTTPSDAGWRFVGETEWHSSGETVYVDIATGESIEKEVEFKQVSGYFTPANKMYTITKGATAQDNIVYAVDSVNGVFSANPDRISAAQGSSVTTAIMGAISELADRTVNSVALVISYVTDIFDFLSASKSSFVGADDPVIDTVAGTVTYIVNNPGIVDGQQYNFGSLTIRVKDNATTGSGGIISASNTSFILSDSIERNATFTPATVTIYTPVTQINVTSQAGNEMLIGSKLQLEAEVLPAAACQDINWTSSDEAIATVDANGLVTAKEIPGKSANVTITANALDGSGVTGSIVLTVKRPKVVEMSFEEKSYELETNESTKNLYAELNVAPQGAYKPLTTEIVWESSNPNFSVADGVVSINTPTKNKQTTTVTAKYTNEDSETVTAICTVNSQAAKVNFNLATKLEARQSGGGTGTNIEPIEVWLYSNTNTPLWNGNGVTDINGNITFKISLDVLTEGDTVKLWIKGQRYLAKLLTQTVTLTGETDWNVTMPEALKAADADNDNKIRMTDYEILDAAYMTAKGEAGYDERADFNADGKINLSDFTLLGRNYLTNGDSKPQSAVTMMMEAAAGKGSLATAVEVLSPETAKVAEEALAASTAQDEETQKEEILTAVQNATGAELNVSSETASSNNSSSNSSNSGGCNAGFGALALMFAIPLVWRKRKNNQE